MSRRRVVVTGLGVISSVGLGVAAFEEALRTGKSGISPIKGFDPTGFPCQLGGEVQEFQPGHWLKRIHPDSCGRAGQFGAAAARLAVDDAGLDLDRLDLERFGCCVGTTDGESQVIDRLMLEWVQAGPEGMTPALTRQVPANRLAMSVSKELNLRGEAVTLSNACAAGNYSIGHAFDLIQTGEMDFMVCGGADSVCRKTFAGFYRLGAITPTLCQPFDKNRQGILTGEGSGMLVLETLESAQARGARIYAEILGYGLNCDANHMVAPDPVSIAECMRRAHKNAGIQPHQVDYISAHGTGTRVNDSVESTAIREVFGERVPPTSSIKSMIGHTMGAASALGTVACALALFRGFMPPTINVEIPDPDCIADCVPNDARKAELNVVQNNGFAFGGNNAVVILGRQSWASTDLM